MPGCCLAALLMFFGPRLVLFFAWLLSDWYDAFSSWLLALLGFFFLPWTSLAWMYVYFHNRGELDGGYVVLVIFAVLVDLSSAGGGRVSVTKWRERA